MPPRQQPANRYRGSRRLPKLPSKRYAKVVMMAIISAAVVAFSSGTLLPQLDLPGMSGLDQPTTQALSVDDRLGALDKANRTDDRAGLAASGEQGAADVWVLPLHADSGYHISSTYDSRWGGFHYGVDMAVGYGTPYYAAHAGVVTVSRFYSGYGYAIVVEQPGGIEVRYGHSSRLLVTEGQKVQAGQLLGLVGCSGQCTGPHLHFEIRTNGTPDHQDGVPVDGIEFMLARGVDLVNRTETVR